MIKTFQLGKVFSTNDSIVEAVDDLTIDIASGSIVGLLGPNGAGKTTTVRMLSTILRPSKGGAFVGNFDILQEPLKVRECIGLLTESPSLYGRLTAKRNLRFYADLYGIQKQERDDRIKELLRNFDLIDVIDHRVETFSKGMIQKLSICKALIHDPEILMMDEPWSGLSPIATKELREMIEGLSKDHKRTILISTHNLAQAERLVDEILIISKGKLIASGTPADLRKKFMVKPMISITTENKENFNDLLSSVEFASNIDIKPSGNVADITINSFQKTPDLINHLVNQGVRIHGVQEKIPSLEEIYIKLVKEDKNEN